MKTFIKSFIAAQLLSLVTKAQTVHHGEVSPNGSIYFRAEPVNNFLPDKHGDIYYYLHLQGISKTENVQRVPLNLSVVLDRSGSMEGGKLNYTKQALKYIVNQLDSRDKKLFKKLNKGRGGLFLILLLIGLLATIVLPLYYSMADSKGETPYPPAPQPGLQSLQPTQNSAEILIKEPGSSAATTHSAPTIMTSTFATDKGEIITMRDTLKANQVGGEEKKEVHEIIKKKLPYFNEAGLVFFQQVKEHLFAKLLKLDNQLYTKVDPGSTMYKNKDVLVSPFVMSNLPVTNLHYKVFLADLFRQGKIENLEKCLPKQERWNEYACNKLAKTYFESDYYNDFPVVNIGKEAMLLFCNWMEEEMNKTLATPEKSKIKLHNKKKEITVRLPYDYEWIYAADAAYAVIPDCGGYNTIYDASEGLVDNSFFKRTSQVNKREKKNTNRIDKLNDVNRFGMSETDILAIFKEAMTFSQKKAESSDPSFSKKVEDCCLAGHVVELINARDGGTNLRGCCWKDKEAYLKMSSAYTKFNASPFVEFRVVYVTKNGTYKEPFW